MHSKSLRLFYLASIVFALFIFSPLVSDTFSWITPNNNSETNVGFSYQEAFGSPSATVKLDQSVYSWTDRVYITVNAPANNTNHNAIDSVMVTVATRNHTITNYKLVESGLNTGVFTGYVILTGDPTARDFSIYGSQFKPSGQGPSGTGPTDGLLPAEGNDDISVSFHAGTNQVVTGSSVIRWNIGEISWLHSSYSHGSQGVIQVVDPDMSLYPKLVNSFPIKVWSNTDPHGVQVMVTETSAGSGIFQGIVYFTKSNSFGNKLHVSEVDTVTASYEDRTIPTPTGPFVLPSQMTLTSNSFIGMRMTAERSQPYTVHSFHAIFQNTPPVLSFSELRVLDAKIDAIDIPEKMTRMVNFSIPHALHYMDNFAIRSLHIESTPRHEMPILPTSPIKTLNKKIPFKTSFVGESKLEPAVATNGSFIFYTTNVDNAISTDNGTTWKYMSKLSTNYVSNPCIDQDVIYDPKHQIFIWEQMTAPDPGWNLANEKVRLSVSKDLQNWRSIDIAISNFTDWTGQPAWWEYPQLAITDKFLFVTANVEISSSSASNRVDNVIMRIDPTQLEDPAVNPQIDFSIISDANYTTAPVQGASDPMFFATQTNNNTHLTILRWYNSDNTAQPTLVKIDPWVSQSSQPMNCSHDNWCGGADTRVLNGWQVGNRIGFFWNAYPNSTAGLSYPFVNAAMFYADNLTYIGNPYMASSSTPWMYANSYPTSHGLGWIAYNNGTAGPVANIGIVDSATLENYTSTSDIPWVPYDTLMSSRKDAPDFGDYVRIRPLENDCGWLASGYTFVPSNDPLRNPNSTLFIAAFSQNNCNQQDGGISPEMRSVHLVYPPSGLGYTSLTSSDVSLSWNQPSSCLYSQITGYMIERSTNGGHWIILSNTSSTSYSDASVSGSTAYAYRVSSINATGTTSKPSDVLSVTTPNSGICGASAAFGGDLADHKEPTSQLQSIKDFRDNSIDSTRVGADFMKVFNPLYFSASEPISSYEIQNPWFQQTVKFSIYPMLYILEYSEKPYNYVNGELGILSYGILACTLIGSVYLSPFALLVRQVRKSRFNYKVALTPLPAILIIVTIALLNDNNYLLTASTSFLVLTILAVSAILTAKLVLQIAKFAQKKFG
ncbi:MAG: hypothetical protein KGI25_00095 [Thaumarchaeota archaeon]|nr:hypothetical protein [Nitrososphaerota archaeon]